VLEEIADNVLHHFWIQPSLGSLSESTITGPVKVTELCHLAAKANSLHTGVAVHSKIMLLGCNTDGCKP
jgi:hypothetical protein